jgi:hypothetical protein
VTGWQNELRTAVASVMPVGLLAELGTAKAS